MNKEALRKKASQKIKKARGKSINEISDIVGCSLPTLKKLENTDESVSMNMVYHVLSKL